MPATTLKLPAELKERIATLIEGSGKSMHAFLLEAVEVQTRQAERRQRFVADALEARADALRTGSGYGKEAGASQGQLVAEVIYSRRALADLERIAEFLDAEGSRVVRAAVEAVMETVELLARHPLLGREVEQGLRELVISRGKTGYLALYDFREDEDVVLILALRHQRELWGD
jgi:plasmid stabilization system protein ParE